MHTSSFVSLLMSELVVSALDLILAPGFIIACTSKSWPRFYWTSFAILFAWLSPSITIFFLSFLLWLFLPSRLPVRLLAWLSPRITILCSPCYFTLISITQHCIMSLFFVSFLHTFNEFILLTSCRSSLYVVDLPFSLICICPLIMVGIG